MISSLHPPTPVPQSGTSTMNDNEANITSGVNPAYHTYEPDTIQPIGVDRPLPVSSTHLNPPRLYASDLLAQDRRPKQPSQQDGPNTDPNQSMDKTEHLQAHSLWEQIQYMQQHEANGSQSFVPNQPRQANYTEDIARYIKTQQDEIALHHAEDLAAGRVQPSGEGGFHPPPGPSDPTNTTVFVGGLHHNVTEPELFKFFQPFGQISYVSCLIILTKGIELICF